MQAYAETLSMLYGMMPHFCMQRTNRLTLLLYILPDQPDLPEGAIINDLLYLHLDATMDNPHFFCSFLSC